MNVIAFMFLNVLGEGVWIKNERNPSTERW